MLTAIQRLTGWTKKDAVSKLTQKKYFLLKFGLGTCPCALYHQPPLGLSYTSGIVNRTGYKAEADGEAVAKLKTSGAIPLLVSNTPELCCCFESNNLITGRTNNPYDTTCTSGGSSGGEEYR
ncbi:hypothetical protein NQ318_003335 [Aromia moschata]|uniref:Amidase domain-containing protein n=1 Tax=Aromia moschata TaxID=1265417 RepID=A0AAV8XG85_9CUCU|nr:hypothetical protein NQ318_003335 [Aromia moschata]